MKTKISLISPHLSNNILIAEFIKSYKENEKEAFKLLSST